ncbi:type II toxin-antitoxin system RelE/ParE family toxin [Bradyrhizobium sp. STM 3809]|uniref:type II toxin-antitoxin system RelE/ParE family toxin n=1 Tax=Bradyrhizobium sp. STM 3809 TaxID=551936 RepID=UPI0002408C60|nr:type II toxin-antitoxin system RelE/ParE family toxin [Bradyrhizobium sp. STM 3809]CCD99005.1 Plasmid stabilization system [Bradyrhizobium sp. STM 3809]
MTVILTAEAEADLEQIVEYVEAQSPASALKLLRQLRDKCDTLIDAPRGYPLVPRYEDRGIRRRPFGQFLIFYRLRDDTIEIIHILHGARDYEKLLFPED